MPLLIAVLSATILAHPAPGTAQAGAGRPGGVARAVERHPRETRRVDPAHAVALPPAPPWDCSVSAVVWWHRPGPGAHDDLPPGSRPLLPVTVGALLRYERSPVGPYSEVLGCPVLLRGGGLVHTTVPFIAVDSIASVAGGRAHWALPKVLAAFGPLPGGTRVDGDGWQVHVRPTPVGPSLPVAARFSTTQDGRLSARSRVRGRARLARVRVDGSGLPPWLRPGRHPGLVLSACPPRRRAARVTPRRLAVVALVYVLPLGLTAVVLSRAGLGLLAGALLAVEAVVAACVALARRPARTPASPATPRDGSTVLLVLGGVSSSPPWRCSWSPPADSTAGTLRAGGRARAQTGTTRT